MRLATISQCYFGELKPINSIETAGEILSHVPKIAVNYLKQNWNQTSWTITFQALPKSALILAVSPLLILIDAIGTLVRRLGIFIDSKARTHLKLYFEAENAQRKLDYYLEFYLPLLQGYSEDVKLKYALLDHDKILTEQPIYKLVEDTELVSETMTFTKKFLALKNEKSITLQEIENHLKHLLERGQSLFYALSEIPEGHSFSIDKFFANPVEPSDMMTEEQQNQYILACAYLFFSQYPHYLLNIVKLLKELPKTPVTLSLNEKKQNTLYQKLTEYTIPDLKQANEEIQRTIKEIQKCKKTIETYEEFSIVDIDT